VTYADDEHDSREGSTVERGSVLELRSVAPMKVARALLGRMDVCLGDVAGVHAVYEKDGMHYLWSGSQWKEIEEKALEDFVWFCLEDAVVVSGDDDEGDGEEGRKKLNPGVHYVWEVVRALQALVRFPYVWEPAWVGKTPEQLEALPDPEHVVAFEDVLVDVAGSAKAGTWRVMERGPDFFTTAVLPCRWEDALECGCPTWERAMDEWGCGDPVWTELRERVYGYGLMRTRKYSKWLLEYGKVRGGKGTGTRVLRWLLSGSQFMGTKMDELADRFGLDGVENCRVLVISEAHDLDGRTGSRLASVIKSIVGGDPVVINVKHRRQKANVVLRALPIVQTNPMLSLPNDARGLSSKMLALEFRRSFEGAEDFGLDEKLRKELPGIARRFVEAAVRLEASESGEKFVMPERSMAVVHRFDVESNAFDAFLSDCFVQAPKGWVNADEIRRLRRMWEEETGCRLLDRSRSSVSDQMLLRRLCEYSTWNLAMARRSWVDAEGTQRVSRGLQGLAVRRNIEIGEIE